MLYIRKNTVSTAIQQDIARVKSSSAWHNAQEGDTRAIRSCFDSLNKSVIRTSLLEEQHYLCAYCMKRIKDDGPHTTIEHWKPLSKNKELALDYGNFLAVCKGGSSVEASEYEKKILCCDANKGDQSELTIDPRNEEMMSHIKYQKQGIIFFSGPSESVNHRVNQDINVALRLNGVIDDNTGSCVQDTSTQLVKGRRDAFKVADRIIFSLEKSGKLTAQKIETEIRKIENAQKYPEFAGVILFRLKRKQKSLLARKM